MIFRILFNFSNSYFLSLLRRKRMIQQEKEKRLSVGWKKLEEALPTFIFCLHKETFRSKSSKYVPDLTIES